MDKETEKFDWERRVWSTCFAHFWLVPKGDTGCLLSLASRYKPLTGFGHKPYEVTMEPQGRVPHLLHAGHFIHSRSAHCRVSKVQQKTCSLGEQRTRAPSILTLSWRIPDEPPNERLLLNDPKTPGFLASRGEEFNPGPEIRLDRSELLCNKVLLKYKGDRESFWHRHQKGAERVPPC